MCLKAIYIQVKCCSWTSFMNSCAHGLLLLFTITGSFVRNHMLDWVGSLLSAGMPATTFICSMSTSLHHITSERLSAVHSCSESSIDPVPRDLLVTEEAGEILFSWLHEASLTFTLWHGAMSCCEKPLEDGTTMVSTRCQWHYRQAVVFKPLHHQQKARLITQNWLGCVHRCMV